MAGPSVTDTAEIVETAEIVHIKEDVLKAATEKLEAHVGEIEFKIHRFPANLRGFGWDSIAPRIVAFGPYYHGVPELQAMEEVKRMAAYYFCEGLADSPDEVYKKILPVAREVRGCYADADALEGITDDNFAAMMFFDGCFLVQYMVSVFSYEWPLLRSAINSKGTNSIVRDMMLLENQIPWPVLQLLTDLSPKPVPMKAFISQCIAGFGVKLRREPEDVNIDEDFEPPHLLGLIHFHQVRSSSVEKDSKLCVECGNFFRFLCTLNWYSQRGLSSESVPEVIVMGESGLRYVKKESRLCLESGNFFRFLRKLSCKISMKLFCSKRNLSSEVVLEESVAEDPGPEESIPAKARIGLLSRKEKGVNELTVTTSAAELAEIGVKLKPSGTSKFEDMEVVRGPLFATLSIAPLFLDGINACWLVNMAAFEQCTGGLGEAKYSVNAYLSVMAQLMNRDDDVRELRRKRILHTTYDYNQTLMFFKWLAPHLTEDSSYFHIMVGLEEYKQERWVWIAIYKFLYNNRNTIATVLSIVGVLVGIFKTLISLKQHQP